MNRRTLGQRLLYHHLPLAVASGTCFLLVFALVKAKYLPFRLSMATAYTGTLLHGVTLVLGVLKVLRGARLARSRRIGGGTWGYGRPCLGSRIW